MHKTICCFGAVNDEFCTTEGLMTTANFDEDRIVLSRATATHSYEVILGSGSKPIPVTVNEKSLPPAKNQQGPWTGRSR